MSDQIIRLIQGDSFEKLKEIPDNSLGGTVSDPPYLISFMGKKWDAVQEVVIETPDDEEEEDAADLDQVHASQLWHVGWLKEIFRAMKPGTIAKVFAATRTQHRLAAAMESVGFVDLDLEAWCYGSGFPKSLNVSKQIDKVMGKAEEREVIGTSRGVAVEDDQGFGGIARGAVGVVQKAVDIPVTAPASDEAKKFDGYGTALKPAWEPFVVGRKPL